jgi:hypothetical protein
MTPHDQILTTSIEEAGKVIGQGKNGAYESARNGQIHTIDVGKNKRVPVSWLAAILRVDMQVIQQRVAEIRDQTTPPDRGEAA